MSFGEIFHVGYRRENALTLSDPREKITVLGVVFLTGAAGGRGSSSLGLSGPLLFCAFVTQKSWRGRCPIEGMVKGTIFA
ncbi:hypothetical protein R75483_07700 [Paraburkholderia domus]|nr:hypothetical protein R75483_07700 [Paraburkholderia domus]